MSREVSGAETPGLEMEAEESGRVVPLASVSVVGLGESTVDGRLGAS